MSLSAHIMERLRRLLGSGIPFALYSHPGSAEAVLIEAGGAGDGARVALCPWNTIRARAIDVGGSAAGTAAGAVWRESTIREKYCEAVGKIIASHTPDSGKTVVSRAICRHLPQTDWAEAARLLFARTPDAFRYVAYTPATGAWMGATPELLADIDGQRLRTMALAGTRTDRSPWDEKNLREHAMVADFIADTLRAAGARVDTGTRSTLVSGPVEHLHTPIEAELAPGTDIDALLDALSPTPAVAGLPRDKALGQIAACEAHPRRLYAGYIDVADADGRRRCYVNLRCMNFDPAGGDVCLYAGGGITALSDPASEWNEASAKARPLLQILDDAQPKGR